MLFQVGLVLKSTGLAKMFGWVFPYAFKEGYGFSSGHVWMWKLDYKESWVPKNWCFWTVVLEKTLESPLDCKEIQPVHPKGDQSWMFIGRTDAEAETPILWPPRARADSFEKTLMLGKIEGRRRRGTTEDEMIGWHHRLDGHGGFGDGQGGLACCSSWGRKESDTTERLNWTEGKIWMNFLVNPIFFSFKTPSPCLQNFCRYVT